MACRSTQNAVYWSVLPMSNESSYLLDKFTLWNCTYLMTLWGRTRALDKDSEFTIYVPFEGLFCYRFSVLRCMASLLSFDNGFSETDMMNVRAIPWCHADKGCLETDWDPAPITKPQKISIWLQIFLHIPRVDWICFQLITSLVELIKHIIDRTSNFFFVGYATK